MQIIERHGHEDLALLYLGRTEGESLVEFVESVQPPIPRNEKWVLIVSTLKGCPVRCSMCDAGGNYSGKLSSEEILSQIDTMVTKRFPDRHVPIPKFKVQFARMGEPTLNEAVLDVLQELPERYHAPGLLPCISSVLPQKCKSCFDKLRVIKDQLYPDGRFQLQFSLHTTDTQKRRGLINYPVLNFTDAAKIGKQWFVPGDRKIALNFAATDDYPIQPQVLIEHFDPSIFVIKITPLNPTDSVQLNGLRTQIDPHNGNGSEEIIRDLKCTGYDVILSLGEPEEDQIGSNCGQYLNRYVQKQEAILT